MTSSDDVTATTPSRVQQLLRRHGLAPRKSDGQNFLVDQNTVERLVHAAGLSAADHVLEVGPGLGAMTLVLQDRVAGVTAVEIDAGLSAVVAGLVGPNVDVIHDDVLKLDLAEVLPPGARLVANLPYNAATPILLRLLDSEVVADAWVMTQREVGERWIAVAGDDAFGAVSVKVALLGTAAIELTVPRTVFHPTPNVDSVMVRVTPTSDRLPRQERRQVGHLAELSFRQRRKTLRNNLKSGLGADAVAIAADHLDVGRRAETLAVAEWIELATQLRDAGIVLDSPAW